MEDTDAVRHLSDDDALRTALNLIHIPQASTLGNWLRKMGDKPDILKFWARVNKIIVKAALHNRKGITLDIYAIEIIANKKEAKRTYKKNKSYMSMVGHIAEIGQVVSCDFRQGNDSPAKEDFEFIQQCHDHKDIAAVTYLMKRRGMALSEAYIRETTVAKLPSAMKNNQIIPNADNLDTTTLNPHKSRIFPISHSYNTTI
jgi:hypothetical protein